MSRVLPHLQRDSTPHFVTFNTEARWILADAARDIVLDSCRHDHLRTMELHIATVMSDHVHLIFTPLPNHDRLRMYSLAEILWAIKSASAHRINRLLNRQGKVWQDEYFDTAIRRSESLEQKVEYVRQNPVRGGLVKTAEDYRWTWESPRPRAAEGPKLLVK
jgi:putative transposase